MSRVSELAEQLKATSDPAVALELLGVTTARSHVEAALHLLASSKPHDRARPVLRERFDYYSENPDKDRGATLREALVRLLIDIAHPDDLDVYERAIAVYEGIPPVPSIDAAQKLRAAALVGIADIDHDLATLYAVKLLSELRDTSEFSGEPALTALNLLVRYQRWHALFHYVLMIDGYRAEYADVVSHALEKFNPDFPPALYAAAARRFIARDQAVEQTGIVGYVVENRRAELYPLLDEIITTTRSHELHRYTLIALAAARDPALNHLLFALAKRAPLERVSSFIEALELVPGSDDLLALLRTRRR